VSILDVQNLTLKFGGLTAVDDVSFSVEKGQIFSIIGPNGAGKTTVFNAITGVYPATSGKIKFEGREIVRPFTWKVVAGCAFVSLLTGFGTLLAVNASSLWQACINANYVWREPFPWNTIIPAATAYLRNADRYYTILPACIGALVGAAGAFSVWQRARRTPDLVAINGIARTFQNIRLFADMSVQENVLVGMHAKLKSGALSSAFRLPQYWIDHRKACKKAHELLDFVEMQERVYGRAASFSYGHQRRIEIARALATEPRLLLLDEPAAGMNPAESAELMDLIRKIRDRGVSVLLIEHDMKVVMGVSDRIAVLDYGEKIAEGTPDEVRHNPKVMEAYLGSSELK
jgi:branched-chain amino acid transport system ATP-binding protein